MNTPTTNGEYTYNGIDRVDNDLGYNTDNCVSCCKWCNYAKTNMTQEEFIQWVKSLSITLSNKGLFD